MTGPGEDVPWDRQKMRDLGWTDTMLDHAAGLAVYPSTFRWRGPKRWPDGSISLNQQQEQEGWRCADCDCRVFDDTVEHKAQHLVIFHGYRMDGRHESEQT